MAGVLLGLYPWTVEHDHCTQADDADVRVIGHGQDLRRRLGGECKLIVVFTRMYGAYEGEALAPKGKLRVIPYICSGTALNPSVRELIDKRQARRRVSSVA